MTVNRVEPRVEPLLLTPHQAAVLRFLRRTSSAKTVQEIATDDQVSLLAPAVRHALTVLAGYGLVENKSATTWGLTPAADALL
jgi:Fe2+ or Zn2+ uptake regulation protein